MGDSYALPRAFGVGFARGGMEVLGFSLEVFFFAFYLGGYRIRTII